MRKFAIRRRLFVPTGKNYLARPAVFCTYLCAEENGMARFVKDDDAAEIAWKLFEQTGSLSYYMLYKQLKK